MFGTFPANLILHSARTRSTQENSGRFRGNNEAEVDRQERKIKQQWVEGCPKRKLRGIKGECTIADGKMQTLQTMITGAN